MRTLSLNSRMWRLGLLASLLGSTGAVVSASYAETVQNTCYAPDGLTEIACLQSNSNVVVDSENYANTERASGAPGAGFEETGFSLSIEGETVAGAQAPSVPQRAQDRALERADVQVKFDGLQIIPRLNVSTDDLRASYKAGQSVTFRSSTNYPAWISRAEVVVIDRASRTARAVAKLPVNPNGQVNWVMPADGSGEYAYVLRVYDAKGRFNETAQLELNRTGDAFATHSTTSEGLSAQGEVLAAGEGEDRTAVSNIPLYGGSVTASGENVRPGSVVTVMGERAVVDRNGRFVIQRILPPGTHSVPVQVRTGGQTVTNVTRSVDIPDSEWFYVAIADVTLSKKIEDELDGTIAEEDDIEADGRLAFYAKGRIKGRTLITASADTGEGELSDIFRRLDEKDPRQVLRRLDPEDTYLVYGDDSSAYDDTPSSGRFYIRVERDRMLALWGDFDADITSGQLVNNSRRLYGGKLEYKSLDTTPRGDARIDATVYAARPDTRLQRDVLQGTGGSAYFLSRQDINFASESLQIEFKDRDTGRVIERQALIAGRDYSIDYLQGVIILTNPLNSSRATGELVTENPIGDTIVELVVDYEFTPGLGDVDGSSAGGSVEAWVSDDLSFKLTGINDETDRSEVELLAATARYHFGKNSWVEGEVARSKGAGLGSNLSTDGGLTFNLVRDGDNDSEGSAYRIETYLDFEDLGGSREGDINIYVERRSAGFSTLTRTFDADETIAGFYGTYSVNDRLDLRVAGESLERSSGERDREAAIELAYKATNTVTVEGGLAYSDQDGLASLDEVGTRTDLGLRLTYAPNEDNSYYIFGQATLNATQTRRNNDRIGVGASLRLSEKVTVEGEVSEGTLGFGALAKVIYQPTADNQVYLGYTLDPSRTIAGSSLTGRDKGVVVAGAKYRFNDKVAAFAENTYDLFGDRKSITEAYGVTYTPNARWTYTGGFEVGEISDPNGEDFDRDAISLGVSYDDDDNLQASLKLEYRTENGEGTARDRDTWLVSGGLEYKYTEEWRLLTTVDALVSDSDESAFRDGRYVELSFGAAYRPILNEKINALFKLTYLDDQPGENQVNANDVDNGAAQRSVILSADVLYDWNEKLTFGAKYGYRKGEVAPRGTNDFTDSTAHLLVLGADWHVVHKWDVFGEVRQLYTEETGTRESGALAGVYRHVGNNAKLGVGYEWGSVSDDVSDIDYNNSGVFLNLIAKF